MRSRFLRVAIVLASFVPFLLTSHALDAQTVTGTLQGTVTDTSGGPLPGATVTVRNRDTGLERRLVTNERGAFIAPLLQIGTYRVTAALAGFGTVARERVEVSLNSTATASFSLTQRITADVEVIAETTQINTVNAEIKGSLTTQQIQDKPSLSQGSFLSLAETFTGFQENPVSGQNNPTLSSGSSVNFNGTGSRGATFQINGVNNDDSSENQNRQGVSLATIKEFQVLTNSYSAEFGRGYGAVVLVQTKSGTNDVKGEVFGYFQDGEWNEKSYFSKTSPKPDRTRNEYGFVAGFPILQNKLFGFVSFDHTDLAGTQNYRRDLFLDSEVAAPWLTRGNDTAENRAWIQGILGRYPQGAVPNDPNASNRTYATLQEIDWPDKDYSARLDYEPVSEHHFSARYQYTRNRRETEDIIQGENALQNHKQVNLGLTWTQVFGGAFSGEFRYGLGVRSTNVDIGAGNDTPIVRFNPSPISGTILGNAGSYPINRQQTDHQVVYNLYGMFGTRHYVKAGIDLRFQQLDDKADNFSRGYWTFRPACGGVNYLTAYAAMLDGCVSTYQRGYGNFYLENRINEYNAYVEDQWQVADRLSLSLGARFEYVQAPSEKEDRIDYPYGDNSYVDPRIGFAWVPSADSGFLKTLTGGPGNASIRGGFGVYHGRIFQSIFSQSGANLRFNPPNAALLSFTNQTNLSDPSNGFVFTPGVAPTTRISILQVDPDLKMPQVLQWNVSFERKLPWDSTIRLSYVGNHGKDLLKYTPTNLAVTPAQGGIVVANSPFNAPGTGLPDLRGVLINQVAADWRCAGTGLPGALVNAACPVPVPIGNNEISLRFPRINERRPDPRYTTNLMVSNENYSNYNAFQLELQKRFTRDFSGQISYTFGKTLDTGSEATSIGAGDTNITGPNDNFAYGYSRFDTRHRLTFLASYDLPFFRDRRDLTGQLLGGWKIAATVRYASGTPFTVTDSGTGDIDWDGFSENRPVFLDPGIDGVTIDDPDTATSELPSGAFRRATPMDSIDDLTRRNSFRMDSLFNVDLGVYKTIFMPWAEHQLVLRAEVYNLFNRAQFGTPSSDWAATTFGRITSTSATYAPRTYQVAVRYLF
jgi:hypothetical protein